MIVIHNAETTGAALILLEFQGKIETSLSSLKGVELGKLNVDLSTFTIGNQQLKGSKVKLARPLAMVVKDGDNFRISGLIEEKILFDSRPLTVMQ